MPLNKIALIRYKTIDQCLRNRNRNWTLDDLIEACSEAVNKAEGTNKGASKRTVQGDLQLMRDPKIGYHAPITVIAKKYYTYADANYSITRQAISKQDEGMIQEAVDFMKHLQDFEHFKAYDGVVKELENILNKKEEEMVLEEKSVLANLNEENLVQKNLMEEVLPEKISIEEKQTEVIVTKENSIQQNIFDQHLADQKSAEENILEIKSVEETIIEQNTTEDIPIEEEQAQTKLQVGQPIKQELQQVGNSIVQAVYTNQELEELANILFQQFSNKQLNENGTYFSLPAKADLKQVLYNTNLQNVLNTLDQHLQLIAAKYYNQIPTANWFTALHQNITIPVKEKIPTEGFTGWSKKDGITSVMAPVELLRNCFSIYIHLYHSNSTNGALKTLPGSHKKILNMQERNLFTENVYTQVAAVKAGGIHIVKPLLLKAFGQSTENQVVHLLQLDFCSVALPSGLAWRD